MVLQRIQFAVFFFFLTSMVYTQVTVTGTLVDQITEEALVGVSVYYDGTTIGTITDQNGYFELYSRSSFSSPLIISYLGYERVAININASTTLGTFKLKQSVVALQEVVLEPDTWSREKKLNIFRREFLGRTNAALDCKILNEEALRFYYNKDEQKMYAYASAPIKVQNDYLGYMTTYDLQDFEISFRIKGGLELVESTYYAGFAFLEELSEKTRRKQLRRRRETYLGSTLHFMRILSQKELSWQGFKVFIKGKQVRPNRFIGIERKENGLTSVRLDEQLDIVYGSQNEKRSVLKMIKGQEFFIDSYGNHSPVNNVMFGGYMGNQRIANLLPLNFDLGDK